MTRLLETPINYSEHHCHYANTFADFSAAVLKKLIMEIAGARPPGRIIHVGRRQNPFVLAAAKNRIAPPCDIGENRWRNRDDF